MKHCFLFLLALVVYANVVIPVSAQSVQLHVVSVDSAKIGGFYNFRFPVKDAQLLRDRLGGHELEITFEPEWQIAPVASWRYLGEYGGVYARKISIRDNTTGEVLAQYRTRLQKNLCDTSFLGSFGEFAAVFTGNDTVGMGLRNSREKQAVPGTFTSDVPCFFPNYIADALGFEFDYTILQYGGLYRADTMFVSEGQADTYVFYNWTMGAVTVGDGMRDGLNNGPAIYEVEFLPGGTEIITTTFGDVRTPREETFEVPYLTMKVRNIIDYKRPGENGDSVLVTYPEETPHQFVAMEDSATRPLPYPLAQEIAIGNYNLTAYGWIDGREKDGFRDRPLQAANMNTGRPVGTQGRYYLSTTNANGHTIDFVHILVASGTEFSLDFADKSGRKSAIRLYDRAMNRPTVDFQPGGKAQFFTFGGALGFPMPGAKIILHIDTLLTDVSESGIVPENAITVTPNPFREQTTISYTLSKTGYVTLTILDNMGRVVGVPVDGKMETGSHNIVFNSRNLANGVYFYRLQTETGTAGGTITLLR